MSKTSFCNKTIVRKDITRFFPLWLAYLVLVMMMVPVELGSWNLDSLRTAGWLLDCLEIWAVNLAYGFLTAVFLFGGLFRGRSAYMLSAFPLRRETWFGSHVASGLLVALIPNTLAGLGCLLGSNVPVGAVALWLLTVTLGYLLAFSTAVLAVSCTGNLIGAGILTALMHFGLFAGEALLRQMLTPLIYGLPKFNGSTWTIRLSLASWLGNDILFSYRGYIDAPRNASFTNYLSISWLHMGIFLAVCLGLLTLALLLYRKRPTESAGDLLSFSFLKKVFPYVFGLYFSLIFSAIVLSSLDYRLGYNIWQRNFVPLLLCLVGTALVGFFAGEMLLHKSFRVFRFRNFLGAGALTLALTACVLCFRFDWLGVTRRVPEQEQVDSVQLSDVVITDEDEIAEVLAIHKILIQEREELQDRNEGRYQWDSGVNGETYTSVEMRGNVYTEDYSHITISYTLKNGRTLTRRYWLYSAVNLPLPQDLGPRLNRLLNTTERQEYRLLDGFPYMSGQEDPWGYLEEKVYYIGATGFDPVGYVPVGSSQALRLSCLPELLEALRADVAEGNLEEAYDRRFAPDGEIYEMTLCNLVLEYDAPGDDDNPSVSLQITDRAVHTLACLEDWGFVFPE